jgi:hypothetical protein
VARMSRGLIVGFLLTLCGCQSAVEYEVALFGEQDTVISRADFADGTCTMLLLTNSRLESNEQPVTGIRLVHETEPWTVLPDTHGPFIYAREVPLDVDQCSPTLMEGEPLGPEGSGTIRFDRGVGSEEYGRDYSRVRFNVNIDGVRFRDTLDIATPPQPY